MVHDDLGDGLGRLGANQPRLRFLSGRPRSQLAGARCAGQAPARTEQVELPRVIAVGIEQGNNAA